MTRIPLVVLPDPQDASCLQAWADVTADGTPLRLLLDTGTPRSAVPHVEPFATRPRQIVPGGRGAFGGPAGEEHIVDVATLRAGDLEILELRVQLQPERWQHPGLLGMDVLGSHRCDFHFDRPRIDLDVAEPPATAWFPLASAPEGTPRVQVTWDQTTAEAVWDTGAGATLVDQSWASRHPAIVSPSATKSRGTDVSGAQADHHWGTLTPCRIGGVLLAEQKCAVVDLSALNASLARPIEVVLGLPLIAQASWCMDYPGRRWTVGLRRMPCTTGGRQSDTTSQAPGRH